MNGGIGTAMAHRHLCETAIVRNSLAILYITTSHVLFFFASNVGLKAIFILSTFTPLGTCSNISVLVTCNVLTKYILILSIFIFKYLSFLLNQGLSFSFF